MICECWFFIEVSNTRLQQNNLFWCNLCNTVIWFNPLSFCSTIFWLSEGYKKSFRNIYNRFSCTVPQSFLCCKRKAKTKGWKQKQRNKKNRENINDRFNHSNPSNMSNQINWVLFQLLEFPARTVLKNSRRRKV